MIHLFVIALFVAALSRDSFGEPMYYEQVGPRGATFWLLSTLTVLWIVTWAIVAVLGRRLVRTGNPRTILRADVVVATARVLSVIVVVLAITLLGWLDAVRSVWGDLVAIDELVAVLPGLIALAMGWWVLHPIDRFVREATLVRALDAGATVHPILSRNRWVWQSIRHHLAVIAVPIALILVWSQSVGLAVVALVERGVLAGDRRGPSEQVVLGASIVQLFGALIVLTIMPVVMCRVWDTVPLESGMLLERLRVLCRTAGVRVRGIRVWRTHGSMINGAVMGLIAPLRYVLLTDALLERLPPRELEAVMAHEIGHIRLHHMPWLAVAVLGAVLVPATVADAVAVALASGQSGRIPLWVDLSLLAFVFAIGFWVFGLISRRFEWQADAFAASTMSVDESGSQSEFITNDGANAMVNALQRVADLNHVPTRRFTWRHGSIAARQRRLYMLAGAPRRGLPINSVVRRIKIASLIAFLIGIGGIVVGVVG